MNQDQINTKMDDYLKGNLSDQEKELFELEIAENPDLKEELNLYRMEHELMNGLVKEKLQVNMKKWDLELAQEETQSNPGSIRFLSNRRQILGIAAAIAVLVVAAFWLFNNGPSSESGTVVLTAKATLNIPVYDEENRGLGIAGAEQIIDSMQVKVFEDAAYPFHYRFKEDLELFLSPEYAISNLQLRLDYLASQDQYILTLAGKRFILDRGFNEINELKAAE